MDDNAEPQWFVTTHWSVVVSAGQPSSARASEALEKLCRTYRPPLYNFIRRKGYAPEDAEDLTQAFFAKLLEKNFWARADPQKGRFRSFLLTALQQFLADQRDRARAAKRGGGVQLISLDEQAGEAAGELEGLQQSLSREKEFDREWASTVLEQARARLREECAASGKAALYDYLDLAGGDREQAASQADMARRLGMSVSAIKSAVSRLRTRYGELVREEIAQTVSSPAELESEIRHLLSVISG